MKQEKKEWVIIKVLEGEHAGEYLPALWEDLEIIGMTEDYHAIRQHKKAKWAGVEYCYGGKMTTKQMNLAYDFFRAGLKTGRETRGVKNENKSY